MQSIGLIVNPIAGMGGRVGLKGTDGADVLERALALAARPRSGEFARRALTRLIARVPWLDLIVCSGPMGGDAAKLAGIAARLIPSRLPPTTAEDTQLAARAMRETGAALILFAGGDGTARDVLSAVGSEVPVLGIPSGVKMQSGVFATSPEAAGELAALFVTDQARVRLAEAEVVDLDEEALRRGSIAPRLHGYATAPFERRLLQSPKARPMADEAILDAACAELARELEPGALYLFGPGATMQRVLAHRGLQGSLLGIDAILDGKLIGRDLSEREIQALIGDGPLRIVIGVIGGQGFLFGRGNLPLSPRILQRAGREGIMVVASQEKLLSLASGCLCVDTGDPETDRLFIGFIRVRTGPGRVAIMRVSTTSILD